MITSDKHTGDEDLPLDLGESDPASTGLEHAYRIERIIRERDRFAIALLRAEQELAAARGIRPGSEDVTEDELQLRRRLEDLMAYAASLEQELIAIRATVSWRVTSPLRRIRARMSRTG